MNVSTEEAVNIGSSNLLHRPKRLRRNSLLKNHLVDRINLFFVSKFVLYQVNGKRLARVDLGVTL